MDEEMSHGARRVTFPRFYGAFLTALCIATVAAVGCRQADRSTSPITVHQQITPQPIRVGPSVVAIQLTDPEAKPISHAAIMVEADMSHPGMAPVFGEAKETTPGSYEAHIDFNMGGDWVVLLHIKLADGLKVERRVDVGGIRSN